MPKVQAKNIKVELTAEPFELALSERNRFRISLSATNCGAQIADPELHLVELFVNGVASLAWSFAVSNGKREANWFALPPGKSVSITWSNLGEALLTGSGDFEMVLVYGNKRSRPICVHVRSA